MDGLNSELLMIAGRERRSSSERLIVELLHKGANPDAADVSEHLKTNTHWLWLSGPRS